MPKFQYASYSTKMDIKTSPSPIARHVIHFNTNLPFGSIWRHLQGGGKLSFKGLQEEKGSNQSKCFKHDERLTRIGVFSLDVKTWQALKEVRKCNEWYRKDFGEVAVLPVSLENSNRRKLKSEKLG